jgi:hypothetical protein
MTGTIHPGPKLQSYLMWGCCARLRMAPRGRPSWLRGQRFRVWVWGWLLKGDGDL